VKHQRGIVGADMASILAKRNQTAQARTAQRTAAIQKAKSEKKEKEAKKTKVWLGSPPSGIMYVNFVCEGFPVPGYDGTQNLKAASERWKGWPLADGLWDAGLLCSVDMYPVTPCKIHSSEQEETICLTLQETR
jgi:hypothetical protein